MSLSKIQREFTFHIHQLIQYAYSIGVELTFGDAYRPKELQQMYIDAGRSKTMNSKHLQRLAVDFNFFIDGKYTAGNHPLITHLAEYWKSLHPQNRWGGNWKSFPDQPHFERLPKE